ncbi:hypothetical protein C8R45DRAFT_1212949 [Mycena sanguinolenta]|nr:hypothetical protein C8R45DRAFT_1212949 [Mycena sanguinolenta]
MFSKLAILSTAMLATLAAAGGTKPPTCPQANLCCSSSSLVNIGNTLVGPIVTTLGIDITDLGGLVALASGCSPIVVGGPNCGNQQVSCGPVQGGLIAFNCVTL